MHILDLLFSDLVFGLGVPLLITAGGLLLSDEFKRFAAAKVCFYLAAVWVCGRVLMWSIFTSETAYVRRIATFLAFGIVGVCLTETIRVTSARENSIKASQEPPKAPPPAPVQQNSSGPNSPNISGNNNTVIIGRDPKLEAEVKQLLKIQQGNSVSPKELLARYPLGYMIFDVDYTNSVFPYHSQALDNWKFGWSNVKIKNEDADSVSIQMPDLISKDGQHTITNTTMGNKKKIGPFGGFFSDGIMEIKVEILAISEKGIVFLIGFKHV